MTGLSAHFIRRLPRWANGTVVFHFVQNVFPKALGLSAHFIRRLPRLRKTGLPFLTSFKTSSQSLGTVGSLHSPTSSVKANGTANAAHCLPRWAPYPKPSKQTLRVRLAFLLLVCLLKQAFDTASKQKSLSLCDRLCRAYGNRTRITRMKT